MFFLGRINSSDQITWGGHVNQTFDQLVNIIYSQDEELLDFLNEYMDLKIFELLSGCVYHFYIFFSPSHHVGAP